MTEAVLQKFEQKAQLIQSLMKAKGYRLIELDLSPHDVMGSTRSYAVSMKSKDAFIVLLQITKWPLKVAKQN